MFTIYIKCLLGTALYPSSGHGYFALFLTTTSFTHFWMSQKVIVFHVTDEYTRVIGKILWHYISTKLFEKKKILTERVQKMYTWIYANTWSGAVWKGAHLQNLCICQMLGKRQQYLIILWSRASVGKNCIYESVWVIPAVNICVKLMNRRILLKFTTAY